MQKLNKILKPLHNAIADLTKLQEQRAKDVEGHAKEIGYHEDKISAREGLISEAQAEAKAAAAFQKKLQDLMSV